MNFGPAQRRPRSLPILNMMTPPRPSSTHDSLPAGSSPRPRCQTDPGVVRPHRLPTADTCLGWPARRILRRRERPQRYPKAASAWPDRLNPSWREAALPPPAPHMRWALAHSERERASPPLNEASRRRPAGPTLDDLEHDAETSCNPTPLCQRTMTAMLTFCSA